jgi:hypothetical protein
MDQMDTFLKHQEKAICCGTGSFYFVIPSLPILAPLTMASSTSPEPGEEIRPFEWLTSASSIDAPLTSAFEGMPNEPKKVLHVGSGSSVLGEYLLEEPKYNIGEVVELVYRVIIHVLLVHHSR